MRIHYAANRALMKTARAKKFANMRAAKERKRVERATADPVMPEMPHVGPRRTAVMPAVRLNVCVRGKWFCFTAHEAPWGGIHPSITSLLADARSALSLA